MGNTRSFAGPRRARFARSGHSLAMARSGPGLQQTPLGGARDGGGAR
jgi:hypothetical protein